MGKRQGGQAFILVLILLAIGALLVVPALRLTGTSLKGSQIVPRQTRALYAVEAMQEFILWKLLYQGYGDEFTYDGQSDNLSLNICGTPVNVIIVMRATESTGAVPLATDDIIRPTKRVEVEGYPEWSNPDGSVNVPNDYSEPYTYTIKLDQLSTDTSQGLDCVYDILPQGLSYVPGTSRLSVDGGAWEDFEPDDTFITGGQQRLRWPSSGFFEEPMRTFEVRQVKEIEFKATGSLSPKNTKFYNWVLLKLGETNTLSGPIAPIILGAGVGSQGGLLEVSKSCDPEIIPPGVETAVKYTVAITNLSGATQQIQSLTDYLPPGFEYCTNIDPPELPYAAYHPDSTLPSGITTANPDEITILTREGEEDRYRLYWTFSPAVPIAAYEDEEDILTLTFWARTTQEVSGSYYNEVTVEPNASVGDIFKPDDMTVTKADYNTNYSWNTGAVMVPAFDSEANADGTIIDTNLALIAGGVGFSSWKVR